MYSNEDRENCHQGSVQSRRIVGDAKECIVIDAGHEADPIVERVGDRSVRMILCTHAHNDHINAIGELQPQLDAPVALHPADEKLWNGVYPDRRWDEDLRTSTRFPGNSSRDRGARSG